MKRESEALISSLCSWYDWNSDFSWTSRLKGGSPNFFSILSSLSYSYLDSLLDLKVEGMKSAPTNTELVTLCSELLNDRTDTIATAIEWATTRLIDNPSIQSRLYDKINSVAGDRKVNEKDTEGMVYLQAFVKELLRRHLLTYFSLTHAAIESMTLAGYHIPADANIDFYLPGISEDPKLWHDPKEVTRGKASDVSKSSARKARAEGRNARSSGSVRTKRERRRSQKSAREAELWEKGRRLRLAETAVVGRVRKSSEKVAIRKA